MKFFTPELFAELNSSERAVVDRAARRWERNSEEYKRHIEGLLVPLPSLREYLLAANLHDAAVVSIREDTAARATWTPLPWMTERQQQDPHVRLCVLTLRTDDELAIVTYLLRRPVATVRHQGDVFYEEQRRWLYDEILIDPEWIDQMRHVAWSGASRAPAPELVHCVLLSDGSELSFSFSDIWIHTIPLEAVCESSAEQVGSQAQS